LWFYNNNSTTSSSTTAAPTTSHPKKAKFSISKSRFLFTFRRTRHSGAPPWKIILHIVDFYNIPAFRTNRRVVLGPLCIHASKNLSKFFAN
jgi:hypothetical protein